MFVQRSVVKGIRAADRETKQHRYILFVEIMMMFWQDIRDNIKFRI